ncbi:ABC transporter permease subunit [Modestobacter sp. I12A-02628]|uniref:ABC transporter permease subunit n=1 Tax=Goekera deserti TaxID=2497753 RepID=A0A7K3WFQ3_9ACTN|nr:ABC transporter permease subunit [Goekera deserti]MPQ99681.1 ABC transporter permease subunit [Goekera deserti]NDI46309.1 ABC transporter permease subunit [Goekera deserti]NEL54759.1 ABC transporter permease subunit [Goekera deserti]
MSSSMVTSGPERVLPAADQPSRPSLPLLVRVELRKSWDTRAGSWLLLVIGLATLAVVLVQMLVVRDVVHTTGDHLATSQLPTAVLLPVVGILLVTSEWSQRTAMATFSLVPQRSRVLVAKVLAAAVLAVVGFAVSLLVSVLATALTPVLTDRESAWTLGTDVLLQSLLVQVLYVLVGVALGLLLLSSPLAIVLNFVLPTVFGIVTGLVSALSWVQEWLDLSTTTAPMFTGDLTGGGWTRLGVSLLLWLVAPMVLGWVRVLRTEIS